MRAVLLDALGTLVGLEPPAPALVTALAGFGVHVTPAEAGRAVAAEMGHYRAEHHRAGTAAGLADVRAECGRVMRGSLGAAGHDLGAIGDAAMVDDVLLRCFRFTAYPEAATVLRALRTRGLALVVCSNWDLSLHDVLAETGLDRLLDGAAVSAVEGVAKPHPGLFARALELAGGVEPAAALHVGDSVAADVAGALAAGVRPVLVQRDGDELRSVDDGGPVPAGVPVLPDLRGLLDLV
ncbi:HAD-superfamily hydrolase [Paraconexibacter sp. AEG42_29]|uniref:HAD-superfamily hydrolase n=1 Tax=Paraconexibacter sp. AEG42_29 TaxID=2997339 RepID=A0AAU7B317_9ACTN